MGQAWSTFLVPGLPSCSGGAWPMLAAARTGDHRHLVSASRDEPLLLLACTIKGYSLAHMAAEAGRLSTLQLLVELVEGKAARLCARLQEVLSWSDRGAELLKSMESKVQLEHMCQLLQPDSLLPALVSWQDAKGVTPLMLAARGGHAECVALLLRHGANPLLLDSVNSRSCLHYAAGAGHARCINILLNEFVTVLQPALGQQQQQRRRLVLLPQATLQDSIRGVTSFVDLRTRTGFSALHYATFWGFLGCVQALLTAGASIDLPMLNPSRQHSELPVVNGSTALHLAADYGHTAIAALLLHAHVTRMAQHPQPAADSSGEWLPWEGLANQDPRVRRNLAGDTPLMLHENRCNASGVMKVLLDAYIPVNRTLPLVLGAVYGGPPRLGVPSLAGLAKSALDQHLTGSLDQLEQQQQQQQRLLLLPAEIQPCCCCCDEDILLAGPLDCDSTPADAACTNNSSSSSSSNLAALVKQLECTHLSSSSGCAHGRCRRRSSCNSSSVGSTPAASRSTSYGSISSLASSSSGGAGDCVVRSSSNASSVLCDSSPCSTDTLPHPSSLASSSSVGTAGVASSSGFAACGGHARAISIDSTIAESVVTTSSAVDRTCAICFDANANVMMAGCCHCVCGSCARSLLERTAACKPALCPFCRAGLSGFVAAPLS